MPGQKIDTIDLVGEVGSEVASQLDVTIGTDVLINTAKVTDADNLATNGVVHVINEVLVPADIKAALPAFLAPQYKVSITAFAFSASGKSNIDDKRYRRVSNYVKKLGLGSNVDYMVRGKVSKKSYKNANSAVISITTTQADGTSTTVTKRIFFRANSTTLLSP